MNYVRINKVSFRLSAPVVCFETASSIALRAEPSFLGILPLSFLKDGDEFVVKRMIFSLSVFALLISGSSDKTTGALSLKPLIAKSRLLYHGTCGTGLSSMKNCGDISEFRDFQFICRSAQSGRLAVPAILTSISTSGPAGLPKTSRGGPACLTLPPA